MKREEEINREVKGESKGGEEEEEGGGGEPSKSVSFDEGMEGRTETSDHHHSPLERFRTPPKKSLSVTDLISPAWCELQHWYSLTKPGRKKRTPAMKQGSVVHRVLEDQVHRSVAVSTTTQEDAWALRIWNVIQGLNTLRRTGRTRELEVWGVVDGTLVNGVIDELSYECPDRVADAEVEMAKAGRGGMTTLHEEHRSSAASLQRTLDDYIKAVGTGGAGGGGDDGQARRHRTTNRSRKIYITDIKTRASSNPTLPRNVSLRPTLMQLLIYHRLLSDLAGERVSADVIFERYRLDPSAPFSDSMIAQIGNLHSAYGMDDDVDDDDDDKEEEGTKDRLDASSPEERQTSSLDMLLGHNSLRQLWTLMSQTFQATFPAGRDSVGDTMKVEYRRRTDGEIIGLRTFVYDDRILQCYLDDVMSWWKGQRAPVGVAVEEAFKCRICEFADECEWRNGKVEESIARHRQRRVKSVV